MILLTTLIFIPPEYELLFLSSLLKFTNASDISYLGSGSSCGHAVFTVCDDFHCLYIIYYEARTQGKKLVYLDK